MSTVAKRHRHYHKSVAGLESVDVYRVLKLFEVTDPCLQHAIKKLLVAGGRGAGKDVAKDVQEAADSCVRFLEMRHEDINMAAHASGVVTLTPPPDLPAGYPPLYNRRAEDRRV